MPITYGAPLRLRVERQLGYKMAKYVLRIAAVESFDDIADGNGGYWEDPSYEWRAGFDRRPISAVKRRDRVLYPFPNLDALPRL